MEHVVVAVPTYAGQMYCRDAFFAFLESLSHEQLSFLFTTNSGEEDVRDLETRAEALRTRGRAAAVHSVPDGERMDVITAARNRLREEFLKGGAQWLYFLDSDVIGPRNQVEAALGHGKSLVTGWYLSTFEDSKGRKRLMPTVYGPKEGYFARQLHLAEVLRPRLMRVVTAGLGCCLIKRDVLEAVAFRHEKRGKGGGEDTCFFVDAAAEGHELWCDTRIACWHLHYPVGDKRNNPFDPRRYSLDGATQGREKVLRGCRSGQPGRA